MIRRRFAENGDGHGMSRGRVGQGSRCGDAVADCVSLLVPTPSSIVYVTLHLAPAFMRAPRDLFIIFSSSLLLPTLFPAFTVSRPIPRLCCFYVTLACVLLFSIPLFQFPIALHTTCPSTILRFRRPVSSVHSVLTFCKLLGASAPLSFPPFSHVLRLSILRLCSSLPTSPLLTRFQILDLLIDVS